MNKKVKKVEKDKIVLVIDKKVFMCECNCVSFSLVKKNKKKYAYKCNSCQRIYKVNL